MDFLLPGNAILDYFLGFAGPMSRLNDDGLLMIVVAVALLLIPVVPLIKHYTLM